MAVYELVPHPDYPATGISRVSADIFRFPDGCFDLEFDVFGALAANLWEPLQKAAFTDELWRSTCFEAFLTTSDKQDYVELNYAPSGLWAAYHFDGYRQGMRRLPDVDMNTHAFRWSSAVSFRTGASLHMLPDDLPWQVNIAAVIEAADGTKSYWALAHVAGPPDFHDPTCFIATLPAPATP